MNAIDDFKELMSQWGLTQAQLDAAKATVQLAEAPDGKLCVKKSNIEGLGTFLRVPVPAGTIVATAFTQGRFTRAGRFANHSPTPNARYVDGEFVTLSPVDAGEELTVNYRQIKEAMYG